MSAVPNQHLHPVFADILSRYAPAPQVSAVDRYRMALRDFDWGFEFSDDHRKVRDGQANLVLLRALQAEVDPDGAIWREEMPKERDGRPLHGAPLPEVVR